MEDFKTTIGDGIDRDISAHTKRTITPLRKLRVWAQRMGKGERAGELGLIPELSNERACSVWGGKLMFEILGDAAYLQRSAP